MAEVVAYHNVMQDTTVLTAAAKFGVTSSYSTLGHN